MGTYTTYIGGNVGVGNSGKLKLLGYFFIIKMYDEKATIWWAGKELDKNKLLS